jgi:hypothetical protein
LAEKPVDDNATFQDLALSSHAHAAVIEKANPSTHTQGMRTHSLVRLVILMAVFVCPGAVRGQKSTTETRPPDYPGYHLLKLGERDADTRAFLVEHFKGSDASVIHGDFDGDGHPDYAMLLKSDTSAAAKLVVLLCDAQGKCRGVYELDITGYSKGAYLSRLPVGSRVAEAGSGEANGSRPLKLTTVGIQLTYFEKGKVALYWDEKLNKIVEIGTGE